MPELQAKDVLSASGCRNPLREGLKARDRQFHRPQGEDPYQAHGSAPYRPGARETLDQDANILLHPGLCGTLLSGRQTCAQWLVVQVLSVAHPCSTSFMCAGEAGACEDSRQHTDLSRYFYVSLNLF